MFTGEPLFRLCDCTSPLPFSLVTCSPAGKERACPEGRQLSPCHIAVRPTCAQGVSCI